MEHSCATKWKFAEPEISLGKGAFASVFKGSADAHGDVAIKVIDCSTQPGIRHYLNQEVRVMSSLRHPCLLTLIDYEIRAKKFYLILEFMSGGELKHFIPPSGLDEDVCRDFMLDIASGAKYLAREGYIHRDLKPQNILMSEKSKKAKLKIADFGMARKLQEGEISQSYIGSPEYMSPEALLRMPYTNKVDLWSIGSIFYEMLTGSSPCSALLVTSELAWRTKINQINKNGGNICDILPKPKNVSALCWDLLSRLLVTLPKKRMSWEEFEVHAYLSNESLNRSTLLFPRADPESAPEDQKAIQPVFVAPQPKIAFKILTLTPQGREIQMFEHKPITMELVIKKAQECGIQMPFIMGPSGVELTFDTLEGLLNTPPHLVYVMDQAFFDKPFQNPHHIFSSIQLQDQPLPDDKDLVSFYVQLIWWVFQQSTGLREQIRDYRLPLVTSMWQTKVTQDCVGAAFSNHVWFRRRALESMKQKIQEKEQSWNKALSQKDEILKKLSTPLLTTGKTLKQFFPPDKISEITFVELSELVQSLNSKRFATMAAEAEYIQKNNEAPILLRKMSQQQANLKTEEANKWLTAFGAELQAFTKKAEQEKLQCDHFKETPLNSPERQKIKERMLQSSRHTELRDQLVRLYDKLVNWEKAEQEEKHKISSQLLQQLHALSKSYPSFETLREYEAQIAKADEISKTLAGALSFYDDYHRGTQELQRRQEFASTFDQQVEQARACLDQLALKEEENRRVFLKNGQNPYLAHLFEDLFQPKDLPKATIQYQPLVYK